MPRTPKSARRAQRYPAPWLLGLVALVGVLLLGGGYLAWQNSSALTADASDTHPHEGGGVEAPHIHGMGYDQTGEWLVIAAHDGLRLFTDGAWQVPELPSHDYMGYSPTNDGFYSSGHPDLASGLVNPLGLVRSTDGGESITTLGFSGESDFHVMAVGYESHAIYLANPAPNSRLPAGIHYSLDEGATWQTSALQGLAGDPVQLTVHPTEAATIALATTMGLFLSHDHGDSFEGIDTAGPVTAATFAPDGSALFFGSSRLYRYDLGRAEVEELALPELGPEDGPSYLAVNPAQPAQMALATFQRDIYLSEDGGRSWEAIMVEGKEPL